ncbi:MAG: fluoride efflux transporter CrcB [Alphaproteobacteria bacterium]|nr:fluoride efflux transporter CrcB [Alphaproteobacteria bacterium]
MIATIGVIALGGACGAVARHGVNVLSVQIFGHGFPWGTLCVNILGSFMMGLLVVKFSHMAQVSSEIRMLCMTGFLGAFTTFSTFSLDVVTLYERGDIVQAGGYVLASVVLSIMGLFLGLMIMRGLSA